MSLSTGTNGVMEAPEVALPTSMPSSTILEQALGYARAGCKILPLHRGLPELRKAPIAKLAPSGVYDATDDLEDVACCWNSHPDANIGIQTGKTISDRGAAEGGWVVIDVDGEAGRASVATWMSEGKNLFETPTRVSTSSRTDKLSLAFWFRYPKGVSYISGTIGIRPGIDIRADGNYQVVPPSLHKTGSTYSWVEEVPWAQVPEVPSWLLNLLKAATEGKERPSRPKLSRANQPAPEEALALLQEAEKNPLTGEITYRPTTWYQNAKKRLKGRDYYPILFEMGTFGEEGGRWKTIQSSVSGVCSLLVRAGGAGGGAGGEGLAGTTPELIYALFVPALQHLEAQDEEGADWLGVGWSATQFFFAADSSKQEAEKAKEIEQKTESLSFIDKVIDGAKQWCQDDALWGRNCSTPQDWLLRKLILYNKDSYFVLQANGYYSRWPVKKEQLVSKFRQTGVGGKGRVIELDVQVEDEKKKKKTVTKTPAQLIDNHSSHFFNVRGVVGTSTCKDAWLEKNGTLVLPLYYRRDDLEPVFNALCDEWLRQIFGDKYEKGCEWLANALAFEEGPICAISLIGPGNAGKKMFVRGLQECINTNRIAKGEQITAKFQESLLNTGILVVNEGFTYSRSKSVPDAFRELTSGDSMDVDVKYLPSTFISNPLRVIMTANNYDMLTTLTGNKPLTMDDIKALGQRILHIDIPQSAPKWLQERGDYKLTNGWVASDAGGASDFTLAKHFMWLYHNRKKNPEGHRRFLVEGDLTKEDLVTDFFVSRTETASKIMLTICKILDNQASGNGDGVCYDREKGEIWLTTSAIVEAFNREVNRGGAAEALTEQKAGSVLKVLSEREVVTEKNMKKARWKLLKWRHVLHQAIEHGWPCKNLMALRDKVDGKL